MITPLSIFSFVDYNGNPLDNGQVKVCLHGNETLASLYDSEGAQISNPVTLNSFGNANIYMNTPYCVDAYIYDSDGVLVRSIGNISHS